MADILIRPIITEKMTNLGEKLNRYGFVVDNKVNKIQVKSAVEKMYGVTVKSVKTINHPAKARTRYTKTSVVEGRKKGYKKAIVVLKEGDTIDFYSNV